MGRRKAAITAVIAEERGVGEAANSRNSYINRVFFTSPCSRVRSQEGQKSGSSITNIIWK
jgi:hypothetical protein